MQGWVSSGPWTRDHTPSCSSRLGRDLGPGVTSALTGLVSSSPPLKPPAGISAGVPTSACNSSRDSPHSPGVSVPGARTPELPPSFLSPVTPFGPLGLRQS